MGTGAAVVVVGGAEATALVLGPDGPAAVDGVARGATVSWVRRCGVAMAAALVAEGTGVAAVDTGVELGPWSADAGGGSTAAGPRGAAVAAGAAVAGVAAVAGLAPFTMWAMDKG